MDIHLFCPQCGTYLARKNTCSCGWARLDSVTHPNQSCWRVQLPASIVGPILLTPQGDAALVGYGSRSGGIGGLAYVGLESGKIRWQHDVRVPVEGGTTLARQRVVLFGDTQGRLHGLHLTDGQPAWQPLSLDGPITAAPLLVQEVRSCIGTARGTLYCLDWRTGHEVWHTTLPRQPRRPRPRISAQPAWSDGWIWVGAYDGHIYALDADSGHLMDVYDSRGEIRTPLQVAGRWLIFGTNTGTLHVVNTRSGKEIWTPFRAKRGIPAAPLLRGGVLYVSSLDHYLYAVELTSGQMHWSLNLGHGLATTPAWINGGWLALGSNRGDVIAVDIATDADHPEVVWRYAVNDGQLSERGRPFPVLGGPTVYNGVVYAGASDGRLYALPWHGGQWERASGALARIGRIEEAAACLGLSALPDADLRTARFLSERGHADIAARIYEELERVTDAARAYEQAARSPVRAEAAQLWEQAGNLWLKLDEKDRSQAARRQAAQARGDTLLDLEWVGDTSFREGETSHIHLRVTNPTMIIARKLHVVAGGPGFTHAERWRAELSQGDIWDCWLERLTPKCAGDATLHIEVHCESNLGRTVVFRWQFQVQVAGQDQPPTVINVARQFTGPAHVVEVEGDAGMVRMDGSSEPGDAFVNVGGNVGMVRTTDLQQGSMEDDE